MPEQPAATDQQPPTQPEPVEVAFEDDGDYTITLTMYDPNA